MRLVVESAPSADPTASCGCKSETDTLYSADQPYSPLVPHCHELSTHPNWPFGIHNDMSLPQHTRRARIRFDNVLVVDRDGTTRPSRVSHRVDDVSCPIHDGAVSTVPDVDEALHAIVTATREDRRIRLLCGSGSRRGGPDPSDGSYSGLMNAEIMCWEQVSNCWGTYRRVKSER
jgi:hypothetical protein